MKIDQMLYGYKSGHTLIASSLSDRLRGQEITDILSDAAGSGEFLPYITGYPLPEDGYYALSKTWYAGEMDRPGCVWTHILLFPVGQMEYPYAYGKIAPLFRRPNNGVDIKNYAEPVIMDFSQAHRNGELIEGDDELYKYVIYTNFLYDKHVFICDDDGRGYENALIDIALKLPQDFKRNFTFCTGSKSNRYYENDVMTYQIASEKNARMMARGRTGSIVFKGSKESREKYPVWANYLKSVFMHDEQDAVFEFGKIYGASSREDIKELSKIFYSAEGFINELDLNEYLENFDKITKGAAYKEQTINEVLYEEDLFFEGKFTLGSILKALLEDIVGEKEKRRHRSKLSVQKKERYAREIYSDSTGQAKRLFQNYIHNKLDDNGRNLVDEIFKFLTPSDLDRLFKLDRSICSVLVRRKPLLASCPDIWRKDINYQMEILGSIPREQITAKEKNHISKAVIENSYENIGNYAGAILGDSLRKTIFERVKRYLDGKGNATKIDAHFLDCWLPIMIEDRVLYMQLLEFPCDWAVLSSLMMLVNPYNIHDAREYMLWGKLVRLNQSSLLESSRLIHAVFCLPIVLEEMDVFDNEIKEWLFVSINSRLEKDELPYEDWYRMDSLLPQVSIEQSWDKCLRLRMAFGR